MTRVAGRLLGLAIGFGIGTLLLVSPLPDWVGYIWLTGAATNAVYFVVEEAYRRI